METSEIITGTVSEKFEATEKPKPKLRGKPWKPGETGNRGGRPRRTKALSLAEKIRVALHGGQDLADFLIAVVNDKVEGEKCSLHDRIRAAENLLERGWGKAPVVLQGGEDGGSPLQINVLSFSSLPASYRVTPPDRDEIDVTPAIEVQSFERRLPPADGSKGPGEPN
ncbi:MAG: hypothetical protein HY695_30500 [Deltaproteobacteria bacterium]|nr:hypothetical protein [Deltaproteobacteria bacterium]